jgi:hypothetical protein
MARQSFRKRFTFWLDLLKSDEYELAEEIEILKKSRSFAKAIRTGLKLWISLKQGRTDVLLAEFPWIKEHFAGGEPQPDTGYQAIREQLRHLEQHIVSEGAVPITKPSTNVKIPNEPVGSPGIEIKKAQGSSSNSAQNFLESMSMFG